MESINYTIEIKWRIKGYDHYGFGEDDALYNLRTNRKLKQSLNGGSIGYWFGKKFKTLRSLRPLLYKPIKVYCPF